ncbi:hypothetical protein J2W22_003454 [Sphingomonas kyeonggiensis]|uniref:hypothetical protein n=1 Tax=Sphingomonas kyeonggiensis TaxID=1268553 RepID=UPI0027876231|nr:hypothetical protein [Sphingomonas kyeonggiensis]MDQ0251390.1 hypothetical protein [Sphingomonas kyeonggiensis]
MTKPRTLAEIIADTARQKLAAADARRNPNLAAEKPRDAILAGLGIIAKALAADGFAYTPSGPKLSRKAGDLTFTLSVQSDRNNIAGRRAAVWIHAAIYSRSLAGWRKHHSSPWVRPAAQFPIPIITTQLGYLSEAASWLEWDFVDAARRDVVADQLLSLIRAGAYPLFSTFERSPEAVPALANLDLQSPEGILSYLLASGEPTLARQTLRDYLAARPRLGAEFDRCRRQFSQDGLPAYRSGIGHDLAAFATATDLL